jgi:hypothetical protein
MESLSGPPAGVSNPGTARAPVLLMRTMLAMLMLGGLLGSRAVALVDQPRNETPRATDLLRAERMAEEVRRRLEMPAPREISRWKRGGAGWGRQESSPAVATDGDLIINLKPPRANR